jgi:hypothetical protein
MHGCMFKYMQPGASYSSTSTVIVKVLFILTLRTLRTQRFYNNYFLINGETNKFGRTLLCAFNQVYIETRPHSSTWHRVILPVRVLPTS